MTVTHARNTPLTYTAVPDASEFDPALVEPIIDNHRPPWKPHGGLWSAPPVETDHVGVATGWTDWSARQGEDIECETLVPVMPVGGIAGVQVSDNAVKELPEFQSWDVASTVWIGPDRISARAPVPAAKLSASQPRDLVDLFAEDQERWTVHGTYTLEQAADYNDRLASRNFDSVETAFAACRWADDAYSDNPMRLAMYWSSAHEYAAAASESAGPHSDEAAAALALHRSEAQRWDEIRRRLLTERLEEVARQREAADD